MASVFSKKLGANLLCAHLGRTTSKQHLSRWSPKKKMAVGGVAVVGGGLLATAAALQYSVSAAEDLLHPPHYPWEHHSFYRTLDAASVRRGFQVYQQVCAACHSMRYIAFRNLVGVSHTEDEAKALAAEAMIEDGPDDNGKMFKRPGKLFDYMPSPYANDNEARAANGGALPPDLSYIVLARHGEEDYIFSLLNGYMECPAGVDVQDPLYYNVYFPGQAIGMAQALYNEIIEYEDGTPATQSQLAKDVSVFLRWAAEPHHDTKKFYFFKVMCFAAIMIPLLWYQKRRYFSMIKSKKIAFKA